MSRLIPFLTAVVAVVVTAPDPAQAQETLKLTFKENSATQSEITQKTHQILTINGMELITDNQSVIGTSSAVGKRGPDGRLPVRTKIESIFSNLSLPGGIEMTFDSNSPVDSPDPNLQPIVDIFRALAGSSYTTVLDENNRAVDIEGADAVLEAAPESIRGLLAGQLDPEYLKLLHNQEVDRLPNGPVRKGDTWLRNETYRLGGGQQLTFETLYEYTGTVEMEGKTLDRITMTTTGVNYKMDAGANVPAKVTSSNLTVDSSKGTLFFDRQRGTVVDLRSSIHIKGDLKLEANKQEFPAQLDLTMEQTVAVKPAAAQVKP